MNSRAERKRRVQALQIFNPPGRPGRSGVYSALRLTLCALCAVCVVSRQAAAQALELVRDTEAERLLKSYEDPILVAAGLDPAAVKMYLVQDPSLNAFAAEGQNIFVNTGLIQQLHNPNEVI